MIPNRSSRKHLAPVNERSKRGEQRRQPSDLRPTAWSHPQMVTTELPRHTKKQPDRTNIVGMNIGNTRLNTASTHKKTAA
ncbi:hypothetical protein H7J83_03870 [Mycobacterium mantenii]|uniref:hypothetical protein n=1 Tax=Mycobacterium mantenii TaxID=560555 RepID=UPI001151518A|nr:hypothetical protein [Mycobacterium mantenii]MCV7241886.1 hypothetical protein [Mycobacterium mantenii]